MVESRLYLFDIDGTLLVTGGVGIRAMELAGQDLFGPTFSAAGMEFAGRLDPLLLDELLHRNSVAVRAENHRRLRARYAERLPELITSMPRTRALPGVHALLATLTAGEARCAEVVTGLLTGNFRETGEMKLRACGIDPAGFSPAVWGDESPHSPAERDHLPGVAMARYRRDFGRDIHPGSVVVIGDTPHDVRCAQRSGCRCLAVATGKYSREELLAAGADAALADLADTAGVVRLLERL
jgi:phosphoglycolate phosphatase